MARARAIGIFLTAVLAGAPGAAWAVPTITVEDAAKMCQTALKPEPGLSPEGVNQRRNVCIALIDGVVGTVQQIAALAALNAGADPQHVKAVFCLPAGVDYPELAQTFVDFAKANTSYDQRVAAALVAHVIAFDGIV